MAGEVAAAAAEHGGTQIGELFMLARHLICGDAHMAIASAMGVACWSEDILADWIDDESIAPAVRAMQVLSESIPDAACRTIPT